MWQTWIILIIACFPLSSSLCAIEQRLKVLFALAYQHKFTLVCVAVFWSYSMKLFKGQASMCLAPACVAESRTSGLFVCDSPSRWGVTNAMGQTRAVRGVCRRWREIERGIDGLRKRNCPRMLCQNPLLNSTVLLLSKVSCLSFQWH